FRSDNFELKMPPPSTEGNQKFKKENQVWGDPNGRFTNFSNGTGTGGGQGSGTGTGQGSGRGTGAGSGTGSGYGGGIGSGNGNGSGVGDGDGGPPPPVVPRGVSTGLKINSKPRGAYTDAARTNNITGSVILKITFLASGQVGGISVVKGLPHGLTESAIAAARRISFEPAKQNGVPITVTKTFDYGFSIY
ncbi:MAG: energy transducer TonB, partial [Pyrinomonadaceae bacterium]